MGAARKDCKNPFFKSKYADLGACIDATREPLLHHGLAIVQPLEEINGQTYLATMLLHTSGEWIKSRVKVEPAKKNDAQSLGSTITYLRRYALSSLCCLATEDDDGHAGSQQRQAQAPRQQQAQVAKAIDSVTKPPAGDGKISDKQRRMFHGLTNADFPDAGERSEYLHWLILTYPNKGDASLSQSLSALSSFNASKLIDFIKDESKYDKSIHTFRDWNAKAKEDAKADSANPA